MKNLQFCKPIQVKWGYVKFCLPTALTIVDLVLVPKLQIKLTGPSTPLFISCNQEFRHLEFCIPMQVKTVSLTRFIEKATSAFPRTYKTVGLAGLSW